DCDVKLLDEGLSRTHLMIQSKGAKNFLMVDLNSTNGTYLNRVRVKSATLKEGDLIQAGDVEFQFSEIDEKENPTTSSVALKSTADVHFIDGGEEALIKKSVLADSVENLARLAQDKNQSEKALATIYKIGNDVGGEENLDKLFVSIMESVMEATGADRGFLILKNTETSQIEPRVIRIHPRINQPDNIDLTISRTIVNECIEKNVAILSSDAMVDERFKSKETILLHNIRSVICVPLHTKSETLGVIYVDSQMVSGYFKEYDLDLLIAIAKQAAIAIVRAQLHADLHNLFYSSIEAIVTALDAKDPYTAGHSKRVTEFSVMLAREMGLSEELLVRVRLAALLHDIGKIGIPDHILRKPSVLTPEEFLEVRKHPCLGAEILSKIPKMGEVVLAVKHHHEKWNGSGYPDGISGASIPLLSRILCVADAFDAMTSNRAYRKNLNIEEAILEINRSIGSHFEHHIAEAFLKLLREGKLKPFYERDVRIS
ncbi:MAG: HD domain-containing phosphohydrolase, partial [Planctomycetota bacterium]